MERLDRHLIGKVSVADNGLWSPWRLDNLQYGKPLGTVSMAVQMEAGDKAYLAVQISQR